MWFRRVLAFRPARIPSGCWASERVLFVRPNGRIWTDQVQESGNSNAQAAFARRFKFNTIVRRVAYEIRSIEPPLSVQPRDLTAERDSTQPRRKSIRAARSSALTSYQRVLHHPRILYVYSPPKSPNPLFSSTVKQFKIPRPIRDMIYRWWRQPTRVLQTFRD